MAREPDYVIDIAKQAPFLHEVRTQQRYVLHERPDGTTLKLDTWTGKTWRLDPRTRDWVWLEVWNDSTEEQA